MAICKVYWEAPTARPTEQQVKIAESKIRAIRPDLTISSGATPQFVGFSAHAKPGRTVSGSALQALVEQELPGYRYESRD